MQNVVRCGRQHSLTSVSRVGASFFLRCSMVAGFSSPALSSPQAVSQGDPCLSVGDLPEQASAVIERIVGVRGAVGAKLRALGFVPDTPLSVIRRSPFRGPVVVLVRGAKVALRFSEAELIRVRSQGMFQVQ